MITSSSFYIITGNIFLLLFFKTWWFKLLILISAAAWAFVFYLVKTKILKHKLADAERQILERNELLTYSKMAEQKAYEKVLQSDKAKTMLLSKINHEIRTPMNGILGMTSLLNQTDLTSEQKEYTSAILGCGESLMSVVNEIMINDILEYSKVESAKELDANDFDLRACIEEVLDVFAAKAARSGIELLYHIDNSVPEQVVGDMRRLRQILMNMIENSVTVTTNGEIYLAVQLKECTDDNQLKLEFEIRDTGKGMTAAKTKLLSDNFSKPAAVTTTNIASGMGLVICRQLVALMGGSISVYSKENEGSVFKFTIYTKAGMQPLRKNMPAEFGGLENKRILIVDDNHNAAELLKKQLENLNTDITLAAAGSEALDILTQIGFDIVITDLTLPGINGIALAGEIKEKYPELPVVLLNTVNDEQYKQCDELFGAVVDKPVKRRMLFNAILSQFRNKDTTGKKSITHKLSENFSSQYPLSVLIAEDNPVNQQWITKILTKLGYQADLVVNGKEVLEVVSNKHYDLILMDVQMPEMDGMEATRMIRLCLDAQPIVIAMTANVMHGDRQDCMQSGMDDYISKPVDLNQLVEMLEKWAFLIKEKKQSSLVSKKN